MLSGKVGCTKWNVISYETNHTFEALNAKENEAAPSSPSSASPYTSSLVSTSESSSGSVSLSPLRTPQTIPS